MDDTVLHIYTDRSGGDQYLFMPGLVTVVEQFRLVYSTMTGGACEILDPYYLIHGKKVSVLMVGDRLQSAVPNVIKYSKLTASKLYAIAYSLYMEDYDWGI